MTATHRNAVTAFAVSEYSRHCYDDNGARPYRPETWSPGAVQHTPQIKWRWRLASEIET
jgi:hypothetical protein